MDLQGDEDLSFVKQDRVILEGTDVLVGIKAELEQPSSERPNEGRVEVSVEWCA